MTRRDRKRDRERESFLRPLSRSRVLLDLLALSARELSLATLTTDMAAPIFCRRRKRRRRRRERETSVEEQVSLFLARTRRRKSGKSVACSSFDLTFSPALLFASSFFIKAFPFFQRQELSSPSSPPLEDAPSRASTLLWIARAAEQTTFLFALSSLACSTSSPPSKLFLRPPAKPSTLFTSSSLPRCPRSSSSLTLDQDAARDDGELGAFVLWK